MWHALAYGPDGAVPHCDHCGDDCDCVAYLKTRGETFEEYLARQEDDGT